MRNERYKLAPIAGKLIGLAATVPISTVTILKNQRWQNQNAFTPEKVCPRK